MSIYALVFGGSIAQLDAATFPVASALVWTGDIGAVIPAPQVGWSAVEAAGVWTFTAPPAPPAPTLAAQASAALSAGLAITLSGTLTLAETVFPVDPTTTGKIGNVVLTILKTGAFPLVPGSDTPPTTFPMKDASGNWHPMTTAQYGAVAAQLASYASALDLIADGNPLGATSLPANSVSISV